MALAGKMLISALINGIDPNKMPQWGSISSGSALFA